MSKSEKNVDTYSELENQFILRLPIDAANDLRRLLKSGVSVKDKLMISLENDARKGRVQLNNREFYARVVDLPCIIESMKTIDCKNNYKTADICQMMICKEDSDPLLSDEEEKNKPKKKDAKVDKKYLYPHGITPPLKNVRKRRFRKTLRKKNAEAPEIEKEIKRLLCGDSEAYGVSWEVVNESEESQVQAKNSNSSSTALIKGVVTTDLLFGEPLSDSDDEASNNMSGTYYDEGSRLSTEDNSHLSGNITLQNVGAGNAYATEFHKGMFNQNEFVMQMPDDVKTEMYYEQPTSVESSQEFMIKSEATHSDTFDYEAYKAVDEMKYGSEFMSTSSNNRNFDNIRAKMESLLVELNELKAKRNQQEIDIANIENSSLRQRFQEALDSLLAEQMEKEHEYQSYVNMMEGC